MTREQKANWLRRYRLSLLRQEQLRMELEEERVRAEGLGHRLDGVPGCGTDRDRLPRALERVEAMKERLGAERRRGRSYAAALEAAIDREEDPRVRGIMRMRYLEGKKWDEVAAQLRLEKRWAQRLLNGAIVTLKVPRGVEKEVR